MTYQELLELASENKRRRELDGPWIGKHKPVLMNSAWRSSQAGTCFNCKGIGHLNLGYAIAICLDCEGRGRVIHCQACSGRGVLWLGGSDYLDCPECEGSGAYRWPRHSTSILVTAERNLKRERELEHAKLSS